jgi:DNA polymerase-3 subunit gamma/tau
MESLYRKYRPKTFEDVVGQQHVVSTLEHAVLEGKTSHAYLFCGPRGTGKTTMARILAKALMCEKGPGHLPDGTCEQCTLIAEGEHPDVYELDAASRTGVDNVREEIISRVGYAPVRGSYKVYIIDEVHMLTTAAFNALLKTLEEPPSHVVFVLCTTDPQKVPATILSRVQRFDFHPIAADEMLAHLESVCESEGFTYEPAALELVVRHARGGMRDALSSLEQLSVFGSGSITLALTRDMLGEVSSSTLHVTAKALAERDVPTLFSTVASLVDAGRDLLQFTRELAAHLRDVYVVAAVGPKPGVVTATTEELEVLGSEASEFGSVDRLARALMVIGDASSEMRTATNQRLVLEIALTRIARPKSDLTLESLADRVSSLEARLSLLGEGVPVAAVAQPLGAPGQQASAGERGPQAAAPANPASAAAQTASTPAAPEARRVEHRVAPPSAPYAHPWERGQEAPAGGSPAPQVRPAKPATVPAAPTNPQPAAANALRAQAQREAPRQVPPAPAPSRKPQAPKPQTSKPNATSSSSAYPAVTDPGELQRRWKQVVEGLLAKDPPRGSLLMQSTAMQDDGEHLLVNLPKGSGFAVKMLDRKDVRTVVDRAVAEVFGYRSINYVEASLAGADIARARRSAPAAPKKTPVAPQPQQAPRPVPSVPAPAPAPVSVPAAAPPAQASAPAQSGYAMPWDDEAVPYDDASAVSYDEEAQEAAFAAPVVPEPSPSSVGGATAPDPAPAPPRQEATPVPSPAPVKSAAPSPAPTPAADPVSPAAATAPPATTANGEPLPQDVDRLMQMLTSVFGDGVTVSVEHPDGAGGDSGSESGSDAGGEGLSPDSYGDED